MKPRGRPKKIRTIERVPRISQFSPRGKPGRPEEAEITYDKFEALRLVDFLGQRQDQAARQMGISRQTVGRMLKEARKKLADGLINGKIIRIIEGNFKLKDPQKNPEKA